MINAIIVLSLLIVVFLAFFLYSRKNAYFLDLKNELFDLKTKQLESETKYISMQQQLFNETEKKIQEQLSSIMKIVNDTLTSSQGNINSQINSANKVINEVCNKIGALETTAKNIEEIGKDISSLQDLLKPPKLRGELGEYLLEELLKQLLPLDNYKTQYFFSDGTKVDAIIKIGENFLPIDSKFPLEKFEELKSAETETEKNKIRKELFGEFKKEIDSVSEKYIKPDEKTFDFAMIYIPAENIFYEILMNRIYREKEKDAKSITNIFDYAISKHIILVSPNSFYAYLLTIAYGLKGLKVEQETKKIIGQLAILQRSFSEFQKEFSLVGHHLDLSVKKYHEAEKKSDKFTEKLTNITGIELKIENNTAIGASEENGREA